eukprot:3272393-Amphidinium_carterae.1
MSPPADMAEFMEGYRAPLHPGRGGRGKYTAASRLSSVAEMTTELTDRLHPPCPPNACSFLCVSSL